MEGQEHIFIITAGATIHSSFPAAIRLLKTVTHVFIFADHEIYTNAPDRQGQAAKQAVRDAIKRVKLASTTLGIVSTHLYVDERTPDSIRDTLIGIFSSHPDARYSFDLSAGSKNLALELFALSLWLDGECYFTRNFIPLQRLPVPRISAKNLPANPNYEKILQIMAQRFGKAKPGKGKQSPTEFNRNYLHTQMSTWYIPVREMGPQGRNRELRQGTLSFFLTNLEAWGFIKEIQNPVNKKEKIYTITPDGELALKFFSGRAQKVLSS